MKHLFAVLGLCAIFPLSSVRAQTAEDQYVRVFSIIQQGDDFSESSQPREALKAYVEAEAALRDFQRAFPGWNKEVVSFRTKYLSTQIAEIQSKLEKPAEPKPPETSPVAVTPVEKPVSPRTSPEMTELQNRIDSLQSEVAMLQGQNQTLEAKLKESLAAKPAEVDPRELAKAQENVRALQKENELLKTSLADAQASAPKPGDAKTIEQLKLQLAQSNLKLNDATEKASKLQEAMSSEVAAAQEKVKALQFENNLLKTDLSRRGAASTSADNAQIVEQLKKQLVDSNVKLEEAMSRAAGLEAELKRAVPATAPLQNQPDVERLRMENEAIKKQLEELQKTLKTPASPDDAMRQLAQTRAQVALLKSDREILELEKVALANRAANSVEGSNPAPGTSNLNETSQLREAARAEIQKQLDAMNNQKQPTAIRPPEVITPPEAVKPETNASGEIAMAKRPDVPLVVTNAIPKEPSPEVKRLLADARLAFEARDLEKARADYLQVLQSDPDNIFVLGNLSAIELEQNRLDEADSHIQKAVKLAPNDAFNFSVLGNLKFKQQKYDEALAALNRAAQLEPTNAVVQNYLGVVLSQKGQRAQAESAYFKAIELNPKYAEAQNNLAVSYLAQDPPFIELARWHYQKAIALGFPRNPEIEKLLDSAKSPAGSQ